MIRKARLPHVKRVELTADERVVLEWLVSGFKPARIARKLQRPYSTIRGIVARMSSRVGAENEVELALYAIHRKLVDDTYPLFYGS